MATKSSSNSVLIVVLLILTIPIWLGIVGGLFGLAMGAIGGIFGVIGGLIGAIFSVAMIPFHILFGWCDWGSDFGSGLHFRGFRLLAFIIIIALIIRHRSKRTN